MIRVAHRDTGNKIYIKTKTRGTDFISIPYLVRCHFSYSKISPNRKIDQMKSTYHTHTANVSTNLHWQAGQEMLGMIPR